MKNLILFFLICILINTYSVAQVTVTYDAKGQRIKVAKASTYPQLTLSGDTLPCEGSSPRLVARGASTYQWLGTTNTDSVYSTVALSDFTIRLVGTSAAGCRDTLTKRIRVVPAPQLNYIRGPQRDTMPYGTTRIYHAGPLSAGCSLQWVIDDNAGIFVGTAGDSARIEWNQPPANTPRTAILRAKITCNACEGDEDTIRVYLAPDIVSTQKLADFTSKLVPNPTAGSTELQIASSIGGAASITVENTLGQKVYQTDISDTRSGSVLLDRSILPSSGNYTVRISTTKGQIFHRLIVLP